ncbi:MAG: hypothetical protein ACK4GG_00510 [Sphingomonas sp.]
MTDTLTVDEKARAFALRHQASTVSAGVTGTNLLAHLDPASLAFEPGLRTKDEGGLGDSSGTAEFDLVPPPAETVRWDLSSTDGKLLASVTRPMGGAVRVFATSGGRYLLTARRAASNAAIGVAQVSLPYCIPIIAPLNFMRPSLATIGVPEAQQQGVLDALFAAAKPVAHHILRPLNVRLIWPGDATPEPFTVQPVSADDAVPLSPDKPTVFDDAGTPAQIFSPPGAIYLTSPANLTLRALSIAMEILRDWLSIPLPVVLAMFIKRLGTYLFGEDEAPAELPPRFADEPGWSFDAGLSSADILIVRCGFGAFDFAGSPVDEAHGSDVDRVLQAAAAGVAWASPASVGYTRFVELSGRHLGTAVAHAVVRQLGRLDAGLVHHLREKPPGNEPIPDNALVVAAGIAPSAPVDSLRDQLGLKRPGGSTPRDFAMLAVDLADQDVRGGGGNLPDPVRWADLATLEAKPWRTGTLALPVRAMPGTASKYDVLAGIVSDADLDFFEARLGTLPPAYGSFTFQPGDIDSDPPGTPQSRYEGTPQPASTMIELIQRDLAAVGIGIGLERRGKYAYRRYVAALTRYDGDAGDAPGPVDRTELKKGHSGWAVREFQIAAQYPNRVIELLGDVAHYANKLHIVAPADDRLDPLLAPAATPNLHADGELDIVAADRLRRWRFTRRRHPIVIVTGTGAGAFAVAHAGSTALATHENLYATDAADSQSYRMFAFDRSGYFNEATLPVTLGDWSSALWGGPHAGASHAQKDITPEAVLGVATAAWLPPAAVAGESPAARRERERRERFADVYRVIAAVGEVEAVGHFDGLNAYDNAVFSYPLFHHTLGLDTRPAQMAAFIRWLQDPSAALLESAYPNAGTGTDWTSADPADVSARREALRDRLIQIYTEVFGAFGIGASRTSGGTTLTGFVTQAGLETARTAGGIAVDMIVPWAGGATGNRQEALHQAYQQWFRTWHWCYRFAAALRNNQALRTALFAYEADWVHRHFEASAGLRTDVRTQQGRAAWVRIEVRRLVQFTPGDARNFAATNHADEAGAILAEIARRRDAAAPGSSGRSQLAGLFTTTTNAVNFTQANLRPWQPGVQPDDIYQRVRDDVLRSLVTP